MVATLDGVEGFEHRADNASAAPAGNTGLLSLINNPTVCTYQAGRLAGYCIQAAGDAIAITSVRRDFPATQTRVFSGWFRLAVNPTVDHSQILVFTETANNPMGVLDVRTDALGGALQAYTGTTGTRVGSTAVNDGNWHLVELLLTTTGASWTMDWQLDGVAQTQATSGSHSATNVARCNFGNRTAGHNATVQWDDVITSATGADYPLSQFLTAGEHWEVRAHVPTGEGTDVIGTTNAITFTGAATGWECTNTWPPSGSNYITYASTTLGDAASNYAEVALSDLASDVVGVWGVGGFAAAFAAGTGADAIVVRVVDGANATLTDIISGDVSEITTLYFRTPGIVAAPGTGWVAGFNGCKIRVGLSSDTNSIPRVSALMLQGAEIISAVTAESSFVGSIPI